MVWFGACFCTCNKEVLIAWRRRHWFKQVSFKWHGKSMYVSWGPLWFEKSALPLTIIRNDMSNIFYLIYIMSWHIHWLSPKILFELTSFNSSGTNCLQVDARKICEWLLEENRAKHPHPWCFQFDDYLCVDELYTCLHKHVNLFMRDYIFLVWATFP